MLSSESLGNGLSSIVDNLSERNFDRTKNPDNNFRQIANPMAYAFPVYLHLFQIFNKLVTSKH
jgi:hypothetical protein